MTDNKQQEPLYRWVKADERNPTDTEDKHLDIGGSKTIGYFDNVGMWRYDTHTIIPEIDLENLEWLEQVEQSPSQQQSMEGEDRKAEDILSGYESVNVMTDYDHYEEHYHKDCVLQAMKEFKNQSPSTPVKDGWVKEKPKFIDECLLITGSLINGFWEYSTWQIKKVEHEGKWYLGWLTGEGEEYGDVEDLKADKYLILPFAENDITTNEWDAAEENYLSEL